MAARAFVVIASQRTGSTLLVRSLDSSPRILCAGEIFHFGINTHHREYQFLYARRSRTLAGKLLAALLERRRVDSHLDWFYDQAGVGVDAVGFKLMISQMNRFPSVLGWLRRRRVAAILLHRRNTFDAALSYYRAAATGRYHSDRPAEHSGGEQIRVDIPQFEGLLRACEADRLRLIKLSGHLDGCLVAYEDLVASWKDMMAVIGTRIGVPGLQAPMALERLPSGKSGKILNEDELRARFEAQFTAQ